MAKKKTTEAINREQEVMEEKEALRVTSKSVWIRHRSSLV